MKTKINLLVVAAIALTITFSACGSREKKNTTTEQTSKQTAYQCPMKCEGDKTYDKPGTCPKCGMDLEEKKAEK